MKYVFNADSDSLIDRILKLNNINQSKISVADFKIDTDLPIINRFKEILLSYKNEKFLIVGDYDCDGICATTIIKKLLDDLKIANNYFIPSRTKDGYGINNRIIDNAINNEFKVILMVDNGVSAVEQLKYAKDNKLITLIIDHHEYAMEPNCDCFLHPNLLDEKYHDMCAAGLCALLSISFRDDAFSKVLGGLASLADMVSVFDYNRYLIKYALENFQSVDALKLLLGKQELSYQTLSFTVIPKINAVSRMNDLMNVNYVVKFLLASKDECLKYYKYIETLNEARKQISKKMYELSLSLIDISKDIIVVYSKDFKEGLCGLLANRLLNEFNKPTIVFSLVDNEYRGSGRSLANFNIYEYLKKTSNLFLSFGGHNQAVGLSISEDKFNLFTEYLKNNPIELSDSAKDVLLIEKDDLNNKLINDLDSLRPFGPDFIEPLLALKDSDYKKIIVANKYPKYLINDFVSAISFNGSFINKKFTYMIGRITKDDYHKDKLSFIIEDLL